MWQALLVFLSVWIALAPHAGAEVSVWIAGATALVAAWVDIQLHPWSRCRWCVLWRNGDPKIRDSAGTSWGLCRVCGGSGKRRRLLARRKDGT